MRFSHHRRVNPASPARMVMALLLLVSSLPLVFGPTGEAASAHLPNGRSSSLLG